MKKWFKPIRIGVRLPGRSEIRFRWPDLGWHGFSLKIPILQRHPMMGWFFGMGTALALLTLVYFVTIQSIGTAPVWGGPGVFIAEQAQNLGQDKITVGKRDPEAPQTINLIIAGARMDTLPFSNMSVGKAGLDAAILITGDLSGGDPAAYLSCENIIFDNVVTPTFNVQQGEAFQFTMQSNTADGLSISPTFSGDPVDITVGSTRGTLGADEVSGGSIDQIIINVQSSDATCKELSFTNVKLFGGGIVMGAIKAGKVTIKHSLIGSGSGINSADMVVKNSFKIQNLTLTNNTEQPISVQ